MRLIFPWVPHIEPSLVLSYTVVCPYLAMVSWLFTSLSNMNTLGTKIIGEVSLFQGCAFI